MKTTKELLARELMSAIENIQVLKMETFVSDVKAT